jgi:HSP20 family protein
MKKREHFGLGSRGQGTEVNQSRSKPDTGGTNMATQTKAVEPAKQSRSLAPLRLVPPADLLDQVRQLYDSIARRAFEIFENNGRKDGRALDDWLTAESELIHPTHVEMGESNGKLGVRMEVPGFAAEELEVALEPRRVTISGKRETRKDHKDKETIYQERCTDQILRVIDLPAEVDAAAAAAMLKDGILELQIPKVAPARKIRIEPKTAG